ncbi:hypothetical protein CEXT_244391, partial [Caerostris extrusa]
YSLTHCEKNRGGVKAIPAPKPRDVNASSFVTDIICHNVTVQGHRPWTHHPNANVERTDIRSSLILNCLAIRLFREIVITVRYVMNLNSFWYATKLAISGNFTRTGVYRISQ